jgi:heat shock protein 1/8
MDPCHCTIGIDLGTTSTCTAVFRAGATEIVHHEGYPSMPSYVAFTERCRMVGLAAKRQAGLNPAGTIFNALRFLGRPFSDPQVQKMIETYPFQVVDVDGGPSFKVDYQGTKLTLNSTEILAMILSKSRQDTQKHLGPTDQIQGVVVSVPASFNFRQRQAIRDAAVAAGLGLVRLTSTAIAICMDYVFNLRSRPGGKLLIIDIGAGFLEVALIDIANPNKETADESANIIQMKASDGDSHLAGELISEKILSLLSSTASPTIRVATSFHCRTPRVTHRLRSACEQAKHELSSLDRSHVNIEELVEGKNFECTLSKEDLYLCCHEICTRLDKIIASTISAANLGSRDIDTVILTGGTAHLPVFQAVLRRYFEDSRI